MKAAGYKPPREGEVGFEKIQDRLAKLKTGKELELKNFRGIDYDYLVCDVYIEDSNLTDHFLNLGISIKVESQVLNNMRSGKILSKNSSIFRRFI